MTNASQMHRRIDGIASDALAFLGKRLYNEAIRYTRCFPCCVVILRLPEYAREPAAKVYREI